MKALFHQEVHTYKFIHLVVAENNFLCRYFCRLGPAFKYAVLSFLSGWGRSFTWFSPRIIILLLRFGFRVSLLNWAIYFPLYLSQMCRTGGVSHPQFRTRFSFLTEFQFKFCTRLSPRKSSPQAWFYRISLLTDRVPYFLFFFSRYSQFDRVNSLYFFWWDSWDKFPLLLYSFVLSTHYSWWTMKLSFHSVRLSVAV